MNMANDDELIRRVICSSQDVEEEQTKRLFELAGPQAAEMLKSKRVAGQFLRSDSPNLRRAAIQVLAWRWRVRPKTDNAIRIREMATHDPDDEVRREALSWIGLIYGGTDDVVIGELLAKTVLDESEKIAIRERAYDGLDFLRWRLPQTSALTRFPEVVDWSYVNSFLDTSRKPQPVDFRHAINQLSIYSPSEEELQIGTAIRFLASGLYEEAIGSATKLLKTELKPGARAFVHMLRAEALIECGDSESAIHDLCATIDLDPNRAKAFRLRSRARELLGDLEGAREDMRRAEEIGE